MERDFNILAFRTKKNTEIFENDLYVVQILMKYKTGHISTLTILILWFI